VDHLVEFGDAVEDPTPMLDVGRSSQRIDGTIPARDQDLVTIGGSVTIGLPAGGTTSGVVSEIERTAIEGADGESVIEFRVEADDVDAFGDLVGAPVTITVESKRTDSVLAVPSAALVGLIDGGNAVEVVDADGNRQRYAVELGTSADGWIEISAGAVVEGQQVVVPR